MSHVLRISVLLLGARALRRHRCAIGWIAPRTLPAAQATLPESVPVVGSYEDRYVKARQR